MPPILLSALVALIALAGGFYQFQLKEGLKIAGHGRVIEAIGNERCSAVPALQACEKAVLHQRTGLLFLACSNPEARTRWIPAVGRLNASGAGNDYVATYEPDTGKVTRLELTDFDAPRGLSVHGMDVVPVGDSERVYVYLINHRPPPEGLKAEEVGADSVVEVFEGGVGSGRLRHLRTVRDENVIVTPNDIVGAEDGSWFYVTNDNAVKTGYIRRQLDILLRRLSTNVGFCHVNRGCMVAVDKLPGNNGIAKSPTNDTFYVNSATTGQLRVLERQADDKLVVTDIIATDRSLDNVSIDEDGIAWVAGLPNALQMLNEHFSDPSIPSPSSALRIYLNSGRDAYFGEKFKVEKVFEDDGRVASGTTTVVHDAERGRLYLTGECSPHLAVCQWPY